MVDGSRGLRWACLLVALTFAAPAWAQEKPAADAQRLAAARELMVAAGSARQFDQVMPVLTANMTKAFVALAPQAEPHIREIMGELLKRFSDRKGELIDQIAAAYAQKLSLDELKELTRFYSTGVGAKFIAVMPELMQQSMALGQRWGEGIGREIDQELRRELKKRGINI